MNHPKQLRVFLTSGDARGIRYAELVNWTGQAFSCPKNLLGDLKQWPETQRPGVYVLFGLDETGHAIAYIGESEDVFARMASHKSSPPITEIIEVLIFTSKDDNLTKGHVAFLEEQLVKRAEEAKQMPVSYGREPGEKTISKPERATMVEFLDNLYLVSSALGHRIFDLVEKRPNTGRVFELKMENGVEATGRVAPEGFIVHAGSMASSKNAASLQGGYLELKETLIKTGVLKKDGSFLKFSQDYVFKTPTPAACVICGSQRSGPKTWRDKATKKTIAEIETGSAKKPVKKIAA
jgi:hypothetical protein